MSRVRCCKCNKNKQKNSFSNNQLKKQKQRRTCKSCISKKQNNDAPKKQNNDAPKLQNNDDASYLESLQNAASKLEEPGQLSFLQRLHEHCIGKLLFTEMQLAYNINPNQPLLAQAGLQRIFAHWPHTFVYRNILIIASDDESDQIGIMSSIKQIRLPFIDSKMRFCRKELLYENGKISNKGIELYGKRNLQTFDIFALLSMPISDEEKEKFRETREGKLCTESENETKKLLHLQQKQIDSIYKINKLKREMIEKQNRMKVIHNDTLIKWNTMKGFLKKQKDILLDTEHLETIRHLLSTILNVKIDIEESDGFNNGVWLRFDEKTIMIPHNCKNEDVLRTIEDIISPFIEHPDNDNDNDNDDESDVMVKFIHALKMSIVHQKEAIKCAEKEFNEYSSEIEKILQNMVDMLEQGRLEQEELWNVDLFPTKLIFDLRGKHEVLFVSRILQKKQMIKQWISQRIDKYEGIGEYGADHLFNRFINFTMLSQITWWIAVLRWLSLPISISNLNLFRKYVQQSVDAHFMPNRDKFGTEIDVMMAVTYFMHATQKRYQSNPLKFVYTFHKNEKLSMPKAFLWEKEAQIITLCHDCFSYVISLIPQYKQSTTASIMNKQIDNYMTNVTTHVAVN